MSFSDSLLVFLDWAPHAAYIDVVRAMIVRTSTEHTMDEGSFMEALRHMPTALCELWVQANGLASLTWPLPPQLVLAMLFCAVLRLVADITAREARNLNP